MISLIFIMDICSSLKIKINGNDKEIIYRNSAYYLITRKGKSNYGYKKSYLF
jgi:hypothetical protein